MSVEIVQLQIYKYLVLGDIASIVLARSIQCLAMELNNINRYKGIKHDIYRVAVDKDRESPTYNEAVLLCLMPIGNYTRVPISK